jgi:hypothetical protein
MTAPKRKQLKQKAKQGPTPNADAGLDPAFSKVIAAFAGDRSVTLGGKFGTTSLMRDGKVFAMLMKGRFIAKLPAAEVDGVVGTSAGEAEHLVMGRRKMNEWLAITGGQRRWVPLARKAYEFVAPKKKR